jgi:hypothetical protein
MGLTSTTLGDAEAQVKVERLYASNGHCNAFASFLYMQPLTKKTNSKTNMKTLRFVLKKKRMMVKLISC